MRLLDKKSLDTAKSQDKKFAIDEAANLIKRIDTLRKTALDEDKKLKLYKEQSTVIVIEEISELTFERDELNGEVNDLIEKRELLKVPLDEEWTKVKEEKTKLSEIKDSLVEKSNQLEAKDSSLITRQSELELAEQRILDEKQVINSQLWEATNSRAQADQILSESKRHVAKRNGELDDKAKSISTLDLELSERENLLSIRANVLGEREIELNNRERLINDKYNTLLRTQERVKQNDQRIPRRK